VPNSGWPIPFEELDRFTPQAMELCEAGAPEFGGAQVFPRSPSMAEGMDHAHIEADAIERFSPPTHFGARYREQLAHSAAVGVLTEAPVLRILARNGQVTGVETSRGVIQADCVVLAAGGLETPRLMLASDLGNDLVGRFYQTHTTAQFGTISFKGPHQIAYERAADGTWCRRYLRLSPEGEREARSFRLFVRPNNPSVSDPSHGNAILSAIHFAKAGLVAEYARILTGARHVGARTSRGTTRETLAHLRNLVLGAPALAAFLYRWVRLRTLAQRKLPSAFLENKRGVYPMFVQAEQVPNPDSRITLSPERDSLDMPRIKVDWRLHEQDRGLFARGMETLRAATRGSGGEIDFDPKELETVDLVPLPGHHIGTARMAATPDQGVCDPNCEVFGTKGLYIAGSAAFPTSGGANPTLAIVALSLRLAEHLRAEA
jgi:choline dehydrogenase-like flavoprotein